MESGIYKIKCLGNGKIYIGSSYCIEKRYKNHIAKLRLNKHINKFLQSAYNKYGEQSFVLSVIEYCDVNNLKDREQFWMDETKCFDRIIGFNACSKSDRPKDYKHTKESKKKMSNTKKKMHLLGLLPSNLPKRNGFKHSDDTIEKIRLSKIGNKNPMFGIKESEEHKKNRMKKMLSLPRWNKGLTLIDDPRIEKLAYWKGKKTPNSMTHTLIDNLTKEKWVELSLSDLSKVCPISIATLSRIKSGKAGNSIKERYTLTW